jgi:hypothetical protein
MKPMSYTLLWCRLSRNRIFRTFTTNLETVAVLRPAGSSQAVVCSFARVVTLAERKKPGGAIHDAGTHSIRCVDAAKKGTGSMSQTASQRRVHQNPLPFFKASPVATLAILKPQNRDFVKTGIRSAPPIVYRFNALTTAWFAFQSTSTHNVHAPARTLKLSF